jgi:hypothetical protein
VTRTTRADRIAYAIAFVLVLALVPAAVAAGGGHGHGGGGTSNCTRNAPGVSVDNNWSWTGVGSWGLPGQQLAYFVAVRNYDVGCSSSSFVVNIATPSGFTVSLPTNTISLKSATSGYLWAYVTSATSAADGDYPLTVTVDRAGTTGATGSYTSYYKVYSSDSTAPTLYWPNPGEGQTISGRTFNVVVSSSDDHAVKKIELYMDTSYASTSLCDNVSYSCQFYYQWPLGASGQHTATFKAYDWMGNVGVMTVHFTVS